VFEAVWEEDYAVFDGFLQMLPAFFISPGLAG
jgi:hypothetical protein